MTQSPKERLHEAGESGKKALKNVAYTVNNAAAAIGNTLKALWQGLDAGDKAIGYSIEKKLEKKGKNTTGKVSQFFRNNILKLFLGTSLLTFGGVQATKHVKDKHEDTKEIVEGKKIVEGSYMEKFGDDEKIFVIDVSENNNLNQQKFTEWNNGRRNNEKTDVRGVSGIYIRVQKEGGADKDYEKFYEGIKEYNNTAKIGQEIAIGGYVYFNKSTDAITDEGIEKQVDAAIERLNITNNESDSIVDLIPMLDFEFSKAEVKRRNASHPGEKYPKATSKEGIQYRKAILKRLQLYEEKTGIKPGIYTGGALYYEYFVNDPELSKYPVWIATYNGKRVDQSEDGHSVKIGPIKKPIEIQPDLVQFAENINNSGFGTETGDNLDGSSTTKDKFKELIIKNNDAPNDLYNKNSSDVSE